MKISTNSDITLHACAFCPCVSILNVRSTSEILCSAYSIRQAHRVGLVFSITAPVLSTPICQHLIRVSPDRKTSWNNIHLFADCSFGLHRLARFKISADKKFCKAPLWNQSGSPYHFTPCLCTKTACQTN